MYTIKIVGEQYFPTIFMSYYNVRNQFTNTVL